MDKSKIERINYLAKKSRQSGLSDSEKAEQKLLRDEYRAAVIKNLKMSLDSIEFAPENPEEIKKRGS